MKENIGQKIKQFRKRAGLSQMDLELEIDMAPGGLSRIESGKVKPIQKTIQKISNSLKLSTSETANLLGLNIYSPEELLNAIRLISESLDLPITLQASVDILYNLYPYYNGGLIFLKLGNKMIAKTVSRMPGIDKVFKVIGKLDNYPLFLSKNSKNLIIKSVLERKNFQTFDLFDFTIDSSLGKRLTMAIGSILGFQSGIVIPMLYEGEAIGAVMFTKRVKEDFSKEENLLELLTKQIVIAIKNAEKFELLMG